MTRESFETRFSIARPKLMNIARSMLPYDRAEDAVQNAALSAWKNLHQLKSDDAFDPWIMRILRNECIQMQRSMKRSEKIENAVKVQNTEEGCVQDRSLADAFDELGQTERELILLHHKHGYTIKEISNMLAIPEPVIKMRLFRARNKLRILLITVLLLLLGIAVTIAADAFGVNWFFANRRASPLQINGNPSAFSIFCESQYLCAEAVDLMWEPDMTTIYFTYSLIGKSENPLIVHNANIGVDGIHFDHIWESDRIIPIDEWADGRTVYTYSLDGWKLNGHYLGGSEDHISEGSGETFLSSFYMESSHPQLGSLITSNEKIELENTVTIRNYATGDCIEETKLIAWIEASMLAEWSAENEMFSQ